MEIALEQRHPMTKGDNLLRLELADGDDYARVRKLFRLRFFL